MQRRKNSTTSNCLPNRDGSSSLRCNRFRMLWGLLVIAALLIAFGMDSINSMLTSTSSLNFNDGTSIEVKCTTDTPNKKGSSVPEGFTERIEYYKDRYKYQPPTANAANSSNSRDSICGIHPDYTNWFGLNYQYRSRANEDNLIYNTFFKDDMTGGTFVEIGAYVLESVGHIVFSDANVVALSIYVVH